MSTLAETYAREIDRLSPWADDAEAAMQFTLDWLEARHGDERDRDQTETNEYHRCMARLRRVLESR